MRSSEKWRRQEHINENSGGVYSSDGGEIYIDGKLTKINSVSDAASWV